MEIFNNQRNFENGAFSGENHDIFVEDVGNFFSVCGWGSLKITAYYGYF
jgi:hypothetical protein